MGRVASTAKLRRKFLEQFRQCGQIEAAARRAGIEKSSHYRWLKKYPDYKADFEEILETDVRGLIHDEVVARAIHGWDEPVFSGGKQALAFEIGADGKPVVGQDGKLKAVPAVIRKKSDACLLALAAARIPDFARQSVNHRFVDKSGEDRKVLELDAVTAWMKSQPDPDCADDA